MRSRIIKAAPMIAAYNLTEVHQAAVEALCSAKKVKLVTVPPPQANRQIGMLCGFSGFTAPDGDCEAPPEEECLIFSGTDGRTLQDLLDRLKAEGVYIPLKAVCTASNQSWTMSRLIAELSREHKALNGGGK